MFERIAGRYDLMNDVMSLGIHRWWKRDLAWAVDARAGQVIVDLAGGTGDVARRVAGVDRRVLVVDPSVGMMTVGRARSPRGVQWLAATGEAMPLRAASADTVVIAFGIRNASDRQRLLEESLRVLKPGGRFLCLEFSHPAALVRPVYDTVSRLLIPRLGALIADDREAYRYLVESIARFPDQQAMQRLMEAAGFVDVSYRNLSFGIACVHIAVKPPD